MSELSKFKEKIQLEGCKEPLDIYAYRMDGNQKKNIPEMAKRADLGTPFCCDYLYIPNNNNDDEQLAILIEDTQLLKQWKKEKQEYDLNERKTECGDENTEKKQSGLNERKVECGDENTEAEKKKERENKWERMKPQLVKDNCLKVYGALLILCRLARKHEKISDILDKKQFLFYFVINDGDEGDIKALDDTTNFLREQCKQCLSGTLGGAKLVKKVEVLFPSHLRERLDQFENKMG